MAPHTSAGLKEIVRVVVREEIGSILRDPDAGCVLTTSARTRLLKSMRAKKTQRLIPAATILARLSA